MAEAMVLRERPGRLWLILVGLAAAGFAAATPYLAAMIGPMLAQRGRTTPLAVVLVAQGAQVLVACGAAAFAGVKLAGRYGLDAPWLRALAQGAPRPRGFGRTAGYALIVGSLASIATLAALLAVRPWAPPQLWQSAPHGSFLLGATSAFYGGIVEELLMRWGLLSLVLWAVRGRFWTANVLTAVLFGVGHLPAAIGLGLPLTAGLFAHVLLGNCVAGLVMGWLFRQRGLEAAMIAHAAADVWLHAALPALT